MRKQIEQHLNSDKILKTEELISFKGGTEVTNFWCFVNCQDYSENGFTFATTCGEQEWACANVQCAMFFENMFDYCFCICSPYYS
jgi:hypothetical protein